jgi:cytochrome c oxidase cbb3-type subunit I/II
MYVSGVVQSLMWKEFNPEGFLVYKNFLETTVQILPLHALRAVGGALYLTGAFIMTYNLIMTAKSGTFIPDEEAEAAPLINEYVASRNAGWHHRVLEHKPVIFTVLTLIAILVGGFIEMIPTFLIKSNVPTITSVKPYTPLELHGRDIYVREGCVNCHTQMVRPFRSETERYGEYSKAGEFVYDHPFLWGSKRTGPDLHRVGQKYSNSWHYNHMLAPDAVSTGSIMPAYPWLFEQSINKDLTAGKINAMRTVGVPYENGYQDEANNDLDKQAKAIASSLKADGIEVADDAEIIALIAYLQRLGTDIKADKTAKAEN